MGSEKTIDSKEVAGNLSEVQQIDDLLDSEYADFKQVEQWEDPFELFESWEARQEEANQHISRSTKYASLGFGSLLTGVGGGLATIVHLNQPDIGFALMAGGAAGYAGGTGAYVAEMFRGIRDGYSGFGDHLEKEKWMYTDQDLSGLLEGSQSAISLDTETLSSKKSSSSYEQVWNQIEEEEQYNSIQLNGVRWEETEEGDFIYKLALAEVSDFKSDEKPPEPGDVNINTISEYVGVIDKEKFAEFINPLSMEDSELLYNLEGYSPNSEKLSGGIKRGMSHIYNRIKP